MIGLTDLAGAPVERVRYSAYGVGRHTDAGWAAQKGDWNFDGQVGLEDMNGVLAAFSQQMSGAGPYDPDADFDADGLVGFTDFNKVLQFLGQSKARLAEGKISMQTVANTVGYAGYLYDPDVDMYLARRRWYDAGLGRWMSRDPIGAIGGSNSFEYVSAKPTVAIDYMGLKGYVVGTEEPPFTFDVGSGPWMSQWPPPQSVSDTHDLVDFIVALTPWPNSRRHWKHFLDNSGTELELPMTNFMWRTHNGPELAEQEFQDAAMFAETLPSGHHSIVSRTTSGGYIDSADNADWFAAVGGYQAKARGRVTVCGNDITMVYVYTIGDRFNWDTGKSIITISPSDLLVFNRNDRYKDRRRTPSDVVLLEDADFQPLVTFGLAREFNVRGQVTKTIKWKRGSIPPVEFGGFFASKHDWSSQ